MPPKVTARARPAIARCLRPNCSRLFTGTEAASRSSTMVSMRASIPKALPVLQLRLLAHHRMAPSSTRVGGRSRSRTEIRRHKRATTIAVHQDRIGLDAGLAVDHHHAGSFGSEMPVAPGEQRPQHRPKVAAGISQDVPVARWSFAVAAAFEQTRFDQRLEASCQDVGRDPEALLELIEARQSERRIAQDEDAPPLPDPLQAASDRALHVAKTLAPHRSRSLTCILQAI